MAPPRRTSSSPRRSAPSTPPRRRPRRSGLVWTVVGVVAAFGALALWGRLQTPDAPAQAETVRPRVLGALPHDPSAFTQGLVVDRGAFVESTGLYGSSDVRRVEIATGRVLARRALDSLYFAEGLAIAGDRVYQITWKEQRAFVYDRATLAPLDTLAYTVAEGWGLAHDGRHFLLSDGSATLYRIDPATFGVVGRVEVRDGTYPVTNLNELEYIPAGAGGSAGTGAGVLLANVWGTERVAVIDPESGRVLRWLDLSGLRATLPGATDVLNGIAYDPATRRLFVTGKLWPSVFELDLASVLPPA